MSMKMVCNRCNKVKEDGEHFNRIQYIRSDQHYEDSDYDLCPECAKLFSIFMDGGEVEEDHYKDSKPCAVVIHKLANGHYGIENAPKSKPKEYDGPDEHCRSCKYRFDTPENDEKCINCYGRENYIRDEALVTGESIDKEESDLSVETHTNEAGVTVPDSKPWVCAGTGRIHRKRRPIINEQSSET